MAKQVSDDDRHKLEAALAAALALIYAGQRAEAMDRLNVVEASLALPFYARHKINQQAAETARSVQDGINTRMDAAQSPQDTSQTLTSIDQYNAATLVPYLVSWAATQGKVDAYRDTPASDGSGQSALDATQWTWEQQTAFADDCASAAAASPASYDTLVGIAGGEPPVHRRCGCSIEPA